ncbi:fatty-acid amide hydrolase 1 isoform X2 [Scyliorhinus canicula]|uniref:fatty-acid amide hydrolase 1 isoform X2 n=1 Tax=Scyliorhinus canicula TaxID=7830 RepID=UPI0018F3523C|nr:fatty-acid amide hydrolase 1 isoform X2 [Scyliorhinus canicula]
MADVFSWLGNEFALKPQIYQAVAGLICSTVVLFKLLRWMERKRCLAEIEKGGANRKQALSAMERAVLVFKESGRSGDTESILSLSLLELHEQLQEDSLSPDGVLHAYMEKALEVTKQLNCLTDFLPECQTQLQDLRQNKKGLLYGIPVSIKDNVNYKGHDSTCGLKTFLQQPAMKDSVIVQVLKKQGAIPFVKTNIPQSMLSYECSNPIFGQTVNPHDNKRTPGGSSGGEAALITAGGSILGIGSDIGGSIRVPAAFCGICGFKSTGKRLSKKGVRSSVPGQRTVVAAVGPLAKDVDSLVLCMKALLCEDMFQLDSTVPPIPFNNEVFSSSRRLRIGYYVNDAFWIPNASMKRAVMETKQLLEEAGHTLVPFTPPRAQYAWNELILRGIGADGGAILMQRLKGDKIDPILNDLYMTQKLPKLLKRIISFLLKPFSPRIAETCRYMSGVGSIGELWELHAAVEGVSGAVGLPLAVQCVALPWQDELCLRLMREVERVSQKKRTI